MKADGLSVEAGACEAAPMTDGLIRCGWRGLEGDALYEAYHDEEWGVPERDEGRPLRRATGPVPLHQECFVIT